VKSDLAVEHLDLGPGTRLAPDEDGSMRRTARDWTVDVTCFVLSVSIGLSLYDAALISATHPVPSLWKGSDLAVGGACCLALWWRRRYVTQVAVLAVLGSVISAFATMAVVLIVFSTAVHRRTATALIVAAAVSGGSILFSVLRPQRESIVATLAVTGAVVAPVLAWGMFVRARRQLVQSLRERAERAETEQRLQGERARLAERTRIAREMHDVLAHRISLIALHAGGLEINAALPPDQVRETAQLLRSTARQALEELRDVIGVLRSDATTGEPVVPPPQPTLADVPRLVAELQQAGANVRLEMDVPDRATVSTTLERDAYRIVQEALTNVTKHARGTATEVRLTGAPGDGLRIGVRNRMLVNTVAPQLPGSGAGLLGLQERVALAGGTLTHAPDGHGCFVLDARLPWEDA
jgi:signal transduction histidine kinase